MFFTLSDSAQTSLASLDRTPKNMLSQRRKRGYVLTSGGWQRLQGAIQAIAERDNQEIAYTLHELSALTGLSPNTLTRVRSRKVPVDRQTLAIFFQAFGLVLQAEDYTQSETDIVDNWHYVLQGGQLPLNSPLYVCRPPIEVACTQALLQPGGLVHLKAPKQMGKTSLAARTLAELREQGFVTVFASLQLADATVLAEGKRFFQWFCAVVAGSLGLPNHVEQYWDDRLGNSHNCTRYFEEYVLPSASLLVVALDELDVIFAHPAIATDFLNMVRAWYEKARYADHVSPLWQKLRLLLISALEAELRPYLQAAHFNIGFAIEVPLLTFDQVQDLAQRYQLEHSADCAPALFKLVGGNPYLVQLALYHLRQSNLAIADFLQNQALIDSIYGQHLRRRLWNLQAHPDLLTVFGQVVRSATPIDMHPIQAFKLQSLGLVTFGGQQVSPSCDLYRQYFRQASAVV